MKKIESENIAIAIGVCAALADKAYSFDANGVDNQSDEWKALRHAIHYLKNAIEDVSREEVTYE